MSKSYRLSCTFPDGVQGDLRYLSEKLDKSQSSIIVEIVLEALPELVELVKRAEQGGVKSSLAYAIHQMHDYLDAAQRDESSLD